MVSRQWGAPDFGATIQRRQLLDVFEASRPNLVFIVAPGGYGKSVLAAQMSSSSRFARTDWVDLGGLSGDSRAVLERAYAAVIQMANDEQRLDLSLVSQPNDVDMYAALEAYLGTQTAGSRCIVLDGIARLTDVQACVRLAELVDRGPRETGCVLVTTRDIPEDPLRIDGKTWYIETADLVLDTAEAQAILRTRGRDDVTAQKAETLNAACGGQAALLSVMAMHRISGSGEDAARIPMDLRAHLLSAAVDQLASDEQEVLFGAAQLGHGSCTDLDLLVGHPTRTILARLSEVVPLLHVGTTPSSSCAFRLHDHAVEAFSSSMPDVSTDRIRAIEHRALDHLSARDDFERYFRILERRSPDELIHGLEQQGNALLALGQGGTVRRLLESLPVTMIASRPQLLLLSARLHRISGQPSMALDCINAALTLAREFDSGELAAEARVLKARILLDLSDTSGVVPCLEPVLAGTLDSSPELIALAEAYMCVSLAHAGSLQSAQQHIDAALATVERHSIRGETRGYMLVSLLWLKGPVSGDWAEVVRTLEPAVLATDTSVSMRLHQQSNLVWALIQMGRLHRAEKLNDDLRSRARGSDMLWIASYADSNRAVLLTGFNRMEEALDLQSQMIKDCRDSSDGFSAAWAQLSLAKSLRTLGQYDESLLQAEEALSYFDEDNGGAPTWVVRSQLEVAASRLALGETPLAEASVTKVLAEVGEALASADSLVAHMILTEARRQRGGLDCVGHLMDRHVDYILSESANWDIAMYIRAFPGLLGPIAAAVGVDHLPAHMLRMLMPEHARAALPLAREVLDDDSWRRLAVRLLGEDEAALFESTATVDPLVHVRLFGGLEVITPDGVVPDRAWRKRKARLLFMMLVVRQGRDVPRDVLLEHLWPDMDEERAKNNFYVIWSAMKRALLPADKSAPCPYVEHVGGICRVVRPLVRSDLDDFDDALTLVAEAESAGDLPAALGAIQKVRDIYRADLLPSEVYDDWFRQLRERYRVQFGDAMLRVSIMCRASGDPAQAVQFLRAGLEQDPWREDLYQAAMRCQIDTGQRSGAVDMYMACRSKLAEDLGLDPSVETRRLYDEVLAMEESPRD